MKIEQLKGWPTIGWMVHEGGHPPAKQLADAILSGDPIPAYLRAYVASRIGKPVRGRGRPRKSQRKREERWKRALERLREVGLWTVVFRYQGRPNPAALAREKVAGLGRPFMTPDSLRRLLSRDIKEAPKQLVDFARALVPTDDEFTEQVRNGKNGRWRQMVEESQ